MTIVTVKSTRETKMTTIPSEAEIMYAIENRLQSKLSVYTAGMSSAPSEKALAFFKQIFCDGVELGVELCATPDEFTESH